jgi:vacuolar-type H+-ATPase subunit E/Vma4
MEKISEAVVDKVRAEAQNLIMEAEKESQEEIDKAKKQREIKLGEEKRRMLEEAGEEAARIIAQGSIKGRQKLSIAKADIIDKIIERVKKRLPETASDKNHLLSLIKEAMSGLGTDKGRIYVSPKDIDMVQTLLKGNKKLSSKIEEVKEFDCTGGVIAEDIEGKFRIDNTYETRLEMLLPKLLPEIGKELFEVGV